MAENLSLGFPDPPELGLARPAGLNVALARFENLRQDPGSMIRAIHYQPASAGEFEPLPGVTVANPSRIGGVIPSRTGAPSVVAVAAGVGVRLSVGLAAGVAARVGARVGVGVGVGAEESRRSR